MVKSEACGQRQAPTSHAGALRHSCINSFKQPLNHTAPFYGLYDTLVSMTTAVNMRALRIRPSVPRLRSSQRPFVHPTRQASTAATDAHTAANRTKNFVYGTALTFALSFGYLYVTDTRSSVHEWLVVPVLRQIYPDGEDAHRAGTKIVKALHSFGLNPRERGSPDAAGDLAVELFGHTLVNPIGTSAGMDKGADIPTPIFELGAGLVEVGAVTPLAQEGNPRPRVFRLPSQNALINRYGFNSEGAEAVAMRLRHRVRQFAYHSGLGIDEEAERLVLDGEAGVPPGSLVPGRLLAVQIAKNKTTSEQDIEAVKRDYTTCVNQLAKYADIIVVNVSSPNTPGLRALQNVEPLTQLLDSVVQAAKKVDRKTKPAIMVKVSPDEDSEEQVSGICEAVWDSGVDGVIVGNTTKRRPDPLPKGYLLPQEEANLLLEQGGYSGPQMFERTLTLVKKYRKTLDDGPKQLSPPPSKPEWPDVGQSTGDEPDSSIVPKLQDSPSDALSSATSALLPASANLPTEASPPPTNVDKVNVSTPGSNAAPAPFTAGPRKVIFATGGITNGRQAREILDAGASVAQVYTAIIYGGVGTITRIKEEMREEANKKR
ncbi:Dihydroorotate dehydrogenase (quinone), mitochondrial [Didymosphaeria variabile]|uniref:Dihydroorotate dehydrogenase (quinone), mitochondrial n=1 Tax=Didymosphaeria variabile TaxID=1932322 RepID=A0A9W8XV34_9PLEO|nr:Dihydroorotate dehydrogenase (quinone), mitochondrial [Didymosphaeria variabile]KAJ4360307.1 Dihydroorotate dehydrogenase (quinone), mitochondrial [Didymosphaeria variabile]